MTSAYGISSAQASTANTTATSASTGSSLISGPGQPGLFSPTALNAASSIGQFLLGGAFSSLLSFAQSNPIPFANVNSQSGGNSGNPLGSLLGGGNPLGALTGGGNPLGSLLGGGNPLGALTGGGNPLGSLLGGGNPLGSLLGGGGNPLGSLLGGAGGSILGNGGLLGVLTGQTSLNAGNLLGTIGSTLTAVSQFQSGNAMQGTMSLLSALTGTQNNPFGSNSSSLFGMNMPATTLLGQGSPLGSIFGTNIQLPGTANMQIPGANMQIPSAAQAMNTAAQVQGVVTQVASAFRP